MAVAECYVVTQAGGGDERAGGSGAADAGVPRGAAGLPVLRQGPRLHLHVHLGLPAPAGERSLSSAPVHETLTNSENAIVAKHRCHSLLRDITAGA